MISSYSTPSPRAANFHDLAFPMLWIGLGILGSLIIWWGGQPITQPDDWKVREREQRLERWTQDALQAAGIR